MTILNSENENKVYIEYYITMSCPNRCPYCFVLDELNNDKLVDKSVFENTNNSIKNFKKQNPEKEILVSLLGGDCFSVPDYTIKFCKELYAIAEINLFSNLNYDPNGIEIELMQKYLLDTNIILTLSWHESSNQKWVKENILKFNKNLRVTWVISDKNLIQHYNDFNWLKENTNIEYSIEPMKTNKSGISFTNFKNNLYIEMMKESLNQKIGFGLENEEMKKIALNKLTICRCSNIRIKYNGDIDSFCNFPTNWGNIKDGLPQIKDVFCRYNCDCTVLNYKKIGN